MKNNIETVIRIVHELKYVLADKQKKRAVVVFMVIALGSGFELLGVGAILPFIQAMLSPEVLMEKVYIRDMMHFLNLEGTQQLILLMGIGLIVIYLLKNAFMIFSLYVQKDYSTKIQKELSVTMLNSYMSRPYTFFLDVNTAEILRGCQNDVIGVYQIVANLLSAFAEWITIVAIGCYIIYIDAVIACSVLILLIIVMLCIIIFFKPALKKGGNRNLAAKTMKNKAITQAVSGVKDIFVMRRKEKFLKDYEEASELERKVERIYSVLSESPDRIIEGICTSGIIAIVTFRILMNPESMVAFIPKMATFAMAAFKVLPSIGKITNRMNNIVYYRPSLTNVYENTKSANQYRSSQMTDNAESENEVKEFKRELTINHVKWKYEQQKKEVLNDVSIRIQKGQAIAFIGASGSGKTTLADIILGLLKPQQGCVMMDDVDIFTIPNSWSKLVGYVPQSVYLIDDTIRKNVVFGIEDNLIDEDFVWKSLEQAQIKEFVEKLPNGLDTIVGERGIKFSGGQKQRIAIARALYNQPEILVMDEATAALDNETETAVMESIDALQGQVTMIIVAHRLTTIRNCDVIYEIVDGKAVARDKKEILPND